MVKRNTALILSFILLFSPLLMPYRQVMADTGDGDPALMLMAAAHARISGISDIDKLKDMKSGYRDYYDQLRQNPNLDQGQKDQLAAIRDGKIAALDSRIDKIEAAAKKSGGPRGPLRLLGSFLRRTGRVIGRGIVSAGKTAIQVIRDPRRLIQSAAIMVATGGASSLKDAAISIIKSEFKREFKKVTYAEAARIAYANPTLKKAVELKDFLGIKGNDELEAALKDHYKQQAEKQAAENDSSDEPVGDEGESGYDDPDNHSQEIFNSLAERDRSIKMAGEYACQSINIVPITDEHLAELKAAGMIWSGFEDIADISLSPDAVQGELKQSDTYIDVPEKISEGRLALAKNGSEIEARLSFNFIPDMVDSKLEKTGDDQYRFVFQKEDFITEYVSFNLDSLVPDVPYTLTKEYEQHERPWKVIINATFQTNEDGYVTAEGSFTLADYTSFVVSEYAYYYGYFTNEYSFSFISEDSFAN